MGRTVKYSDEMLAAAVQNSTTFAGVLRYLGLRQAGGTQAHLARRVRRLGLDTSHFVGQGHWRGRAGPTRRTAAEILVRRPAGAEREKSPALRRALIEIGRPYRCVGCGLDPEVVPLTLHVDHISGDWLDNRAENLRFLCPNCHAQTPNYGYRGRPKPPIRSTGAASRGDGPAGP